MRTPLLLVWSIIPVLVGAYHYGPGQRQSALDDVSIELSEADDLASAGQCSAAVDAYSQALAQLPEGREAESRRIRIERAEARMLARQLPEANVELKDLVEEIQADPEADPALLAEARRASANAQYYMTWLMRLEGLAREEWGPEIESSRQTFRLLAEQAERSGGSSAADRREDLESAIRLARMEPGDLQGLAIPKQCQGCKSGQCKGRKASNKPKTGEKDARGASSGPPPDHAGS